MGIADLLQRTYFLFERFIFIFRERHYSQLRKVKSTFGLTDVMVTNRAEIFDRCVAAFFLVSYYSIINTRLELHKTYIFLTGKFSAERNSCAGLTMH